MSSSFLAACFGGEIGAPRLRCQTLSWAATEEASGMIQILFCLALI